MLKRSTKLIQNQFKRLRDEVRLHPSGVESTKRRIVDQIKAARTHGKKIQKRYVRERSRTAKILYGKK